MVVPGRCFFYLFVCSFICSLLVPFPSKYMTTETVMRSFTQQTMVDVSGFFCCYLFDAYIRFVDQEVYSLIAPIQRSTCFLFFMRYVFKRRNLDLMTHS